MLDRFRTWWGKPIQRKDRFLGYFVGSFGGFWIGALGRIFIGEAPAPILTILLWGLISSVVFGFLGVLFPKHVTAILFPFSTFGVG